MRVRVSPSAQVVHYITIKITIMHTEYPNDFQDFLNLTDEKQVILDFLKVKIRERGIKSILDIGAGNGDLSIPLSKLVKTYVAVEQQPGFAQTLRDNGIKVYEKEFPCEIIESSFDLVLACHSIPHHLKQFSPFLDAAWQKTKFGGCLMIITYRTNQANHWTDLMNTIGEDWVEKNAFGYEQQLEKFHQLWGYPPKINCEQMVTFVSSPDISKMLNALAFVYSDANPIKKNRFMEHEETITAALMNKYYNGEFKFPFIHYCIWAERELFI